MSDYYHGARWRRLRAAFLAQHPLCQCPRCKEGALRITKAEVVDHVRPHKGDMRLFWDWNNLQALAKQCHDSWKQQLETSGTVAGCDESGMPLDPNHPWNKP